MDDSGILELYFLRNEQAIQETERKYGAGRILKNREDTEETVNDTWLSAWNAIRPKSRTACRDSWAGSPGMGPLTAGADGPRKSAAAKWNWPWRS